jgi:dTMP kinase
MDQGGIFITFEGIDGAGKSTHIDALAELFRGRGRTVTVTREPGGTPLAEKLRALVLNEPMDALTEALLVFGARRDHLLQVIEPALRRAEVVLCDRFSDSSFAYQGGGQGLDLTVLSALERWVQAVETPGAALRQPDLTLWFDLPPAQAAARLSQARSPDKFEAKGEDFFARVSSGYRKRSIEFPRRFCRIDAQRERAAVWADVQGAVGSRGWLQ